MCLKSDTMKKSECVEFKAITEPFVTQLVLHAFENYDKTPVCVYNDDLTNLETLQKLAEENSGISHLRLKRDSMQ